MNKPFKNTKYITKGIQATLPFEIQLLLWNMIEVMNVKKKDYLQVFKFKIIDKDKRIVQIEHSQEEPKYKNTIELVFTSPIDTTIFCIDDISYSTMLLAEEY
ncbi:DUF960 family protein [Cetobacterium somerae]|uniref:DUF960 family protein n=1 Tax=Cetobacterium somerae TaxID=188913 RepID=UPI0038926247